MIPMNTHYDGLKDSYLFYRIAQKVNAYLEEHPGARLYRMGIGDVSLPLCSRRHPRTARGGRRPGGQVALPRLYARVRRAFSARSHCRLLRAARRHTCAGRGISVSSGASDEWDILDLFDRSSTALVIEPAYPAYVDANVLAGRKILHLASGRGKRISARARRRLTGRPALYLLAEQSRPAPCLPVKNCKSGWITPTGTARCILFDAAYEAFIEDRDAAAQHL